MRRDLLSVLIGMIALPMGCASTHPAEIEQRPNPYQVKGRIQWNSSGIKHVLAVENAERSRTETGLLRVRLVLRNKTKKDVWVDIQTTFTDEGGFEKEKTNWEPIVCTARTQTTYEVVSLGTQVHDFQILIREPKDFSWNP